MLVILLQYITDLFDGAVGRHRDTGLVKWGFYMDHFLDFVFQSIIVIGYYVMAPDGLAHYFFGLLLLTGGYMVNSFLWFAATNRFEISYFGIGPTEVRLLVIAMNASIVFIGTSWWSVTVPPILLGLLDRTLCLGVSNAKAALGNRYGSEAREPSTLTFSNSIPHRGNYSKSMLKPLRVNRMMPLASSGFRLDADK